MAALPEISSPTVDAIYAQYEAKGNKPYITPRIGAASIGNECDRAIWYSFRWTTLKVFTGCMLRLFQTGHIEEARMIQDLGSAGVTVIDRDENTGKQWELVDETGHIVCRMDGALIGALEAPKTWHVLEVKTHKDSSYKSVVKQGVKKAKFEHWVQCQVGMHLTGMQRSFYLARNKDTDALHSERIEYDVEFCVQKFANVKRIIASSRAPAKISNNPSWFKCKFCDHHSACHGGRLPARSCRTCVHSTARDNAEWVCEMTGELRDRDQQRIGCPSHRYIPDFVAGDQVNASVNGNELASVSYLMPDGKEWIDEGPIDAS